MSTELVDPRPTEMPYPHLQSSGGERADQAIAIVGVDGGNIPIRFEWGELPAGGFCQHQRLVDGLCFLRPDVRYPRIVAKHRAPPLFSFASHSTRGYPRFKVGSTPCPPSSSISGHRSGPISRPRNPKTRGPPTPATSPTSPPGAIL